MMRIWSPNRGSNLLPQGWWRGVSYTFLLHKSPHISNISTKLDNDIIAAFWRWYGKIWRRVRAGTRACLEQVFSSHPSLVIWWGADFLTLFVSINWMKWLLSLQIRSNANIRVRDHVSLIWKNTEDVTGSKQILAVRIVVFRIARWKWESLLLTIHYDRNSAP